MKRTLAEAKRLNKNAGDTWFSPETMRFFNTRIHGGIRRERFFITSEQFIDSRGNSEPRMYSIRSINWETGQVETVGEFQEYKTLEAAKLAITQIASTALMNAEV